MLLIKNYTLLINPIYHYKVNLFILETFPCEKQRYLRIIILFISIYFNVDMKHRNFEFAIYSYLKLSTGFLVAALQLCQLTVTKATATAIIPATANTHQLSSVL